MKYLSREFFQTQPQTPLRRRKAAPVARILLEMIEAGLIRMARIVSDPELASANVFLLAMLVTYSDWQAGASKPWP